jgi:hypothetical protein
VLTPPVRPTNPWQIEASGHARRISTGFKSGDDSVWDCMSRRSAAKARVVRWSEDNL